MSREFDRDEFQGVKVRHNVPVTRDDAPPGRPADAAAAPAPGTLVLQGGGLRCLWQAGYLSVVAPSWARPPARIVAVSAGAAIACAFAAGRLEAGVDAFRGAVSSNPRNVYPANVFSRSPVFPHHTMYREVLTRVLAAGGAEALQRGPDVEILLCRPPRGASAARVMALLLGIGLGRRFPSAGLGAAVVRRGGLTPEFVSVRTCADAGEVADLVIASSSTPPFTPLSYFRGNYTLDGGVMESVPMSPVRDDGTHALVLLTSHDGLVRHRASLPARPAIVYRAPSRHLAGAPWDYATPHLVEAFYELGREDGLAVLQGSGLATLKASPSI